jgi:hypothetical protein
VTAPDFTDMRPRWKREQDYWNGAGYHRGFAYVIRAGEDGPIKIGKAMDPEARLAELQTGSWEELRLLHVVPGYGEMERRFHIRLRAAHIRGEWFGGPAAEEFLRWLDQESYRMMNHHEETGELPTKEQPPAQRKTGGVRGNFFGHGMNRAWRVKPHNDAPVSIRFVDPATLKRAA